MLILHECMTARMLISLRNQQNVDFMQRVSSKVLISGKKGKHVDLMLTRDGKDVDFTWKPEKC